MHTVQCLTDFFIKVFADLKDQASLQSYDLAPHPPPSFPLYQSVMRSPSPLKNPRKFKEKQHKNCPRSEVEKSYSSPSDSTVPTDAGNTVFAKTSPKRSFSMTEYERLGLVFTKTRVYKVGHCTDCCNWCIGCQTPQPLG